MANLKMVTADIGEQFAILSDIHLHDWSFGSSINDNGINTRLLNTLDAIEYACTRLRSSFTTANDIIITGDLFHSRGKIKPSILNPTIDLFKKLCALGFVFHVIDGNHDAEFMDSNALGSSLYPLSLIEGFNVYYQPTLIDKRFLFIPWMDSPKQVLETIQSISKVFKELVVFCHVGLSGVLSAEVGDILDARELTHPNLGLKYVFSGHFHNHKHIINGIYSVGNLTKQSWSDVGSCEGFLVVSLPGNVVVNVKTHAADFVDYHASMLVSAVCGNYVRIPKTVIMTKEHAERQVIHLKKLGALAVVDNSARPTESKDHSKTVKLDSGSDEAIKSYCQHNYKDNWLKVYKECLKLKS